MPNINWPPLQDLMANPSKYGAFFTTVGPDGYSIVSRMQAFPSEAATNYRTAKAQVEWAIDRAQNEIYNAMNSGAAGNPDSAQVKNAKHYLDNANQILGSMAPSVAQPMGTFEQLTGQPMRDPQGTQVVSASGNIVTPSTFGQVPPAGGTGEEVIAPSIFDGKTQASSPSTSTQTTTAPSVDQSGWTDAMKQTYSLMEGYVKKLTDQGKMINPNVTLDQGMIDRFKTQAKTELEPYYGQLLKQAEQDIQKATENIRTGYEGDIRSLGMQYGQALEGTQESFARRGLEFSSERERKERELAAETEQKIGEATKAAENKAFELGTGAERKLGSAQLPSLDLGVSTGYRPLVGLPGQYGLSTPTGTRQLFSPTSGTTGTMEQERMTAEGTRLNELAENERKLRALNML